MIVDMIRNDMGRIALHGTVEVERLFALERHPTVWQMTSTVTARTRAGFGEILRAMFPCASITGAPKCRTMQIIAELETTPRGLYTGAIGWISPGRRAQFNVAIRTVVIDRDRREAEYGVGGGIVWDSTEEGEYEECLTKARILGAPLPEFSLLETLAWTPAGGYALLERHLLRLRRSAEYFGFAADPDAVRRALEDTARGFAAGARRVRLLVTKEGAIRCEHAPLVPAQAGRPLRVRLAPRPVDPSNRFLYHKTTHRTVYEEALAECPGADNVLLWNARGELTESTIANLVVEMDGRRFTPPVRCGLLPGTYRAWLLEEGSVTEHVVRVEDLPRCSHLWLVNSVRGQREAVVE